LKNIGNGTSKSFEAHVDNNGASLVTPT